MQFSSFLHYLAVAVGGGIGALTRSLVYQWCASHHQPFPLPTLTVNVVGSLLMGVAWYCLAVKSMLPPLYREFATVGFLGALTTFSTFSLDLVRLLHSGRIVEGVAYLLASVGLCVLGTWAGYQGIKFILHG